MGLCYLLKQNQGNEQTITDIIKKHRIVRNVYLGHNIELGKENQTA